MASEADYTGLKKRVQEHPRYGMYALKESTQECRLDQPQCEGHAIELRER